MVGVCNGTESVTTTEAQEGRTRRGEVRTGQERESRELELKLELPGRCQGREPGPGRAGESRRWACTAWSPTRHRPSAMSSASASGLVGRGTHQRGDRQSGSSRAPKGGPWEVWEVGGTNNHGWRGLGSAGCGLWRRIQWRPLASDLACVLASGLGPALQSRRQLCISRPPFHFPGSGSHPFGKQAKDTTTCAPHDGPYLYLLCRFCTFQFR